MSSRVLLINFDPNKIQQFQGIEFKSVIDLSLGDIKLFKELFEGFTDFYVYGLDCMLSNKRMAIWDDYEFYESIQTILYMFLNTSVLDEDDFSEDDVPYNSLFCDKTKFLFTSKQWDDYKTSLNGFDYSGLISNSQVIVDPLDTVDDFSSYLNTNFKVVNMFSSS